MSILDDEDILINDPKNFATYRYDIEYKSPMAVSLREQHTIDDYARCLAVYKDVMQSYVDFFAKYWVKDDVNKTNRLMTEELANKGLVNQSRQWTGLSEEENNPLGEYVLHLDYPASWSDIHDFFQRVETGDLEFRCRYPIGDTNALDMIKDLEMLFRIEIVH